jgi:hypothetical protein
MLTLNLFPRKLKWKISQYVQNVHGTWIYLKSLFCMYLWAICGFGWVSHLDPPATEEEEIIEMETWSSRLSIPPSSEPRVLILRISEEFKDLKKYK